MTLDEIKQLIEFIKSHELSEFELEHDGVKIRIKSGAGQVAVAVPQLMAAAPVMAPVAAPAASTPVPAAAAAEDDGGELAIVKSPIVGTFYRAAEPGAKAFASVGDVVRKGQVLCIIEAMKLMNEIESEFAGSVLEILVENGKSVEFGQKLFKIKKA